MTTMTTTGPALTSRSAAAIGAGSALIAAAFTVYGAHNWAEIALSVTVLAVVTTVVFGLVVPRALRKDSAGGTALGLSIPAVLLIVPAFWSGLPLVLGVAGFLVGNAGRHARTGSGKCIAALVLGSLAVLGYLATYITDGIIAGNAGFLFD
jgi:hypothetical protein